MAEACGVAVPSPKRARTSYPGDDCLKAALRDMLAGRDLGSITVRSCRQELAGHLGVAADILESRTEQITGVIREVVNDLLDEGHEPGTDAAENVNTDADESNRSVAIELFGEELNKKPHIFDYNRSCAGFALTDEPSCL